MNSSVYSDPLPTYQQVFTDSQQKLHQQNAPSNSQMSLVRIIPIKFNNQPVVMNCPYCGNTIMTVIEEENGALVFLLCILLAIFGFVFGCCLIPFCISALKDKIHFCPRCQKPVGKKAII